MLSPCPMSGFRLSGRADLGPVQVCHYRCGLGQAPGTSVSLGCLLCTWNQKRFAGLLWVENERVSAKHRARCPAYHKPQSRRAVSRAVVCCKQCW